MATSILARFASDFAYIQPGVLAPRRHQVVFSESQRDEVWKSDAIPVVSPHPEIVAASNRELQTKKFMDLHEIRNNTKEVFLVHATKYMVDFNASLADEESPLSVVPKDQLNRLFGPASTKELESVSTEKGRLDMLELARKNIECVIARASKVEADLLDSGLLESSVPANVDARASSVHSLSANAELMVSALEVIRALSLVHTSRIAALPAYEQEKAESAWYIACGLPDLNTGPQHFRSPRLPSFFWNIRDKPLDAPMSEVERQDAGVSLNTSDIDRAMALEHRDRAEITTHRKLPLPLHLGATTPELEHAARTLDSNPSLTQEDKEYMLSYYADALNESPSAFDFSKEKAAWMDPQPQWGWYDPEFPKFQDDAKDVLGGRGKFSAYRGNIYTQNQISPERYGEVTPAHVAAGTPETPLEVVEEAAVTAHMAKSRMQIESALASAAVTAALEKAMGIKPRAQTKTVLSESANAFFHRYVAGQRPAAPEPPSTGHRVTIERIAGAEDTGPAKGGKKKK